MVVRHRRPVPGQHVHRGRLDLVPHDQLRASAAGGDHGEVGSRTVGVDVGQPARDQPVDPGHLTDHRSDLVAHDLVQLLDPIPRGRGLEGLGQRAHPGHPVTPVRHPQERGPPGVGHRVALGARPVAVDPGGGHRAAVVTDQLDQHLEAVPDGQDGRLEAQHQHEPVTRARTRQGRLGRVEQAAVGGVQVALGDRAHRRERVGGRLEGGRRRASVAGSVLQSHPRLGDDAERALGPEHQAVRRRTRPGTGQAERLADADRGDHADRLDEVVDVGPQGGVVTAGPGGDPAAQAGELEALGEEAQGEVVRAELVLERGSQHTGLDAGGPTGPVDLQHAVQGGQVEGRHTGVRTGRALHAADDRGPTAERDDRDVRVRRPVEHGDDVGLVARAEHDVGSRAHVAVQGPDHVAVGLAAGVGSAGLRRAVADRVERGRHCGTGRRQVEIGDPRNRQRGVGQAGDQPAECGALGVGQRLVLPSPTPPGPGSGL